ncbi:MAG: PASTA domain-containing protein [Erysipelotrichaceae bacterium]|nr:PASTA domain-containing protein [Erysipelotrichaceae bacterium]
MGEKKDFLSSIAQEVEDEKAGRTPSKRVMSFEEYEKKTPKRERAADFEDDAPVIKKKPAPVSAPVEEYEDEYEEEAPRPRVISESEGFAGDDGGPQSFASEKLEKVDKPAFNINFGLIGVLAVLLVALGVGLYFFLFAPKIVVPDFVGRNFSDVNAWVKQNKIVTSTIVVTHEYNFDYDKDIVLSQMPMAGEKIKEDTPLTFTVSDGADPDEYISFPDIKSMTHDELKSWISENKLTKTKISTEYSSTVPNGEVIKYSLKSISESDFTRSSTLTITCSKGEAPAGQVTVENFEGKTLAEVQTWAKNKKVTISEQENFSDKVIAGNIISQSPASGAALKEGETLTVVVSKGKGVAVPNLVGYSKDQLEAWKLGNSGVTVITQPRYNQSLEGTVLGQSITPGTVVEQGTVLVLDTSLYMPQMETQSRFWVGQDYLKLQAWVDEVNAKGANIQAGNWNPEANRCDDKQPAGTILDYWCEGSLSGEDIDQGCGRPLSLEARIGYIVSTGGCQLPTPEVTPAVKEVVFKTANIADLAAAKSFSDTNGLVAEFCADSDTATGIWVELINAGEFSGKLNHADTFEIMLRVGSDFKMIVHYPHP